MRSFVRLLPGVLLGLALASPAAAQTTHFLDHCTEASVDTNLTAHTADTMGAPPAYTRDAASDATASAVAATDICSTGPTTTASLWYTLSTTTMGGADYDVKVTLIGFPTSQADFDPIMLGLRYVDNANYYGCSALFSAQQQLGIMENVAGSRAWLGTGPWNVTLAANDVIECMIRGDTIRVRQNGVEVGCVVDASFASAGLPALVFGVPGQVTSMGSDANIALDWDDLTVIAGDGSVTDDNCGASARKSRLIGGGIL